MDTLPNCIKEVADVRGDHRTMMFVHERVDEPVKGEPRGHHTAVEGKGYCMFLVSKENHWIPNTVHVP